MYIVGYTDRLIGGHYSTAQDEKAPSDCGSTNLVRFTRPCQGSTKGKMTASLSVSDRKSNHCTVDRSYNGLAFYAKIKSLLSHKQKGGGRSMYGFQFGLKLEFLWQLEGISDHNNQN